MIHLRNRNQWFSKIAGARYPTGTCQAEALRTQIEHATNGKVQSYLLTAYENRSARLQS